MDFDATRTNYLLHSSDDDHNRKLIEYTNETDTNNNGSVSAEQKIQSTDNHSKILPEQLSTLISSKRLHSLGTLFHQSNVEYCFILIVFFLCAHKLMKMA